MIRSARLEDAPAIADLSTQLGYPISPDQAEERLRDLVDRPDGAVLVAVTGEGTVIGWGHVVGVQRIETGRSAELVGLVVDESHRGRGTGSRLVEAAIDWAVRHGFRTIRVRSNTVRERTHAFYERLGFQRTKTQVSFSKPIGP